MHNSPFIALEGGEGVGKTTQMRMLVEQLPKLFPTREFIFTREPGGAPLAENTRSLIFSKEAQHADGKTMFGYFAGARGNHQQEVIIPRLMDGMAVITDRYAAATFAYQAIAQENPISLELFDAYYRNLDVRPDLTIILDLDPAISQERVRARTGQEMNHFDERVDLFHRKLREGYRMFAGQYDSDEHRVVVLDAAESPELVHEQILGNIQILLTR